jgi:D-glycero-D-manno-heptose 1,7-bisphosphate phosphatase
MMCRTTIHPPTVAFLDRDGTIIRDVHYLSKPDDVELLAGAGHAIARLNNLGVPVVVVTNQSGIARGLFTVEDYLLTEQRLKVLLTKHGAHIDATYYCPDHPDFTGACDCRKPGTQLFERAAYELDLDMEDPGFVGDQWRDILPWRRVGGSPVLIHGPNTPADDVARAMRENVPVVPSLAAAVDVMIGAEQP